MRVLVIMLAILLLPYLTIDAKEIENLVRNPDFEDGTAEWVPSPVEPAESTAANRPKAEHPQAEDADQAGPDLPKPPEPAEPPADPFRRVEHEEDEKEEKDEERPAVEPSSPGETTIRVESRPIDRHPEDLGRGGAHDGAW